MLEVTGAGGYRCWMSMVLEVDGIGGHDAGGQWYWRSMMLEVNGTEDHWLR